MKAYAKAQAVAISPIGEAFSLACLCREASCAQALEVIPCSGLLLQNPFSTVSLFGVAALYYSHRTNHPSDAR
jgi:hypothetical protein